MAASTALATLLTACGSGGEDPSNTDENAVWWGENWNQISTEFTKWLNG